MSPTEIDLARRIIACGLPVPRPRHRSFFDTDAIVVKLGSEVVATCHNPGSVDYDPATRILWQVVTTDTGPELLPVLDDYALLGWLITELERVTKSGCDIFEVTEAPLDMAAALLGKSEARIGKTVCWSVSTGGPDCHDGDTRIEALVAALEAAKAAT